MSYVRESKLEVRAVKHSRSSCTPTGINYYESNRHQPNVKVPSDDEMDATFSYVRSNGVITDSEAKSGVNPPNLDFNSELEICGDRPASISESCCEPKTESICSSLMR